MKRQQEAGVQSSISRFAKPQKAAGSDAAAPNKKKPLNSTLMQILGNSNSNSRAQQQQQDSKLPTGLLHSAITAAAPPRAPSKGPTNTATAVSNPFSSNKSSQHIPAPVLHHPAQALGCVADEPSSRSRVDGSSSLQPCPLCGKQVPKDKMQQHVDQELAEIDLQEQTQAGTASDSQGPRPTSHPQQQQQHVWCADWQGTAPQPNAKRHTPMQQQQHWEPVHQQDYKQQQEYKQQQSWDHQQQPQQPWWQQQQQDAHWQQNHQQQQGHAPWHEHNIPPPQQHTPSWHQRQQQQQRPHKQQHAQRQQRSSTAGMRPSSSSSSSGRVQVKSLSAAPRRPVGPDGQPVTHVDGGFDHWGDSSLNYLDDSAIGIDGGLPSADAYWEGVGRCAVGPRTLR